MGLSITLETGDTKEKNVEIFALIWLLFFTLNE